MRRMSYAYMQAGGKRDKNADTDQLSEGMLEGQLPSSGDDLTDSVDSDTRSTGSGGDGQTPSKGRGRGRRGGGGSPERFQITADRPIFTLSVAADLLGLHPRTLRIYEEKKLVIPSRTEGNRRRYSQRDIQRFQFIRHLTNGGVNLEGVRIILDMAEELSRLGGNPEEIIERNLQALDGP
ncbi:MAG: MerR family transcriptional regulator [Chloroflexota bacterium]|nr:MerR family transcriptional regulator [Chloroflexota bacterium]